MIQPQEILTFWFEEISPAQWWRKNSAFDTALRQRFGAIHRTATDDGLAHWRGDAYGRLAEIIVLDQFSRNLFRNQAEAFATDDIALQLAEDTIKLGLDQALPPAKRAFLYMPFMHAESLEQQRNSVKLFATIAETGNLRSAHQHFDVIKKFGRFPHRNAALGRPSTPAEEIFLRQPGASF